MLDLAKLLNLLLRCTHRPNNKSVSACINIVDSVYLREIFTSLEGNDYKYFAVVVELHAIKCKHTNCLLLRKEEHNSKAKRKMKQGIEYRQDRKLGKLVLVC